MNNETMAAAGAGTEAVAETAIVKASETAVAAKPNGGAYIAALLEGVMDEFKAVNEGLDMDFVYMGTWLVTNKKGNFVERDDDTVNYGDHIDVIVGRGEKRWSLWGKENSPENGQLIVACQDKAEAEAMLTDWLRDNPEAANRYSLGDIELRYMAFVVPVDSISEDGEVPKIYLMSFAPTATIAWGKYAMKVFQGGYKTAGIPRGTGVSSIITRISTTEQKSRKDPTLSWLALNFEAMGMFNPEDYQKNNK